MLQIPQKHQGLVLGALIGAVLGLVFIVLGFWKTLVIAFFVSAGVVIGIAIDSNPQIKDAIKSLIDSIFKKDN